MELVGGGSVIKRAPPSSLQTCSERVIQERRSRGTREGKKPDVGGFIGTQCEVIVLIPVSKTLCFCQRRDATGVAGPS